MKIDKRRIKEELLEALFELAVTLICFLIGALIIFLFGVRLDSPNVDFDLIVLLGIVVLVAIFVIICALVKWFKKNKRSK